MTDFEEISTKFECVKLAMRHTKDGHVVSFAIHPNDTPSDLMTDTLGQRYLAVLVRLDQTDEPVASQATEDGIKAVRLAGTLCGDEAFQSWLVEQQEADELSETAASVALRRMLKVTSRKELKTDRDARQRLLAIRDEFVAQFRRR